MIFLRLHEAIWHWSNSVVLHHLAANMHYWALREKGSAHPHALRQGHEQVAPRAAPLHPQTKRCGTTTRSGTPPSPRPTPSRTARG